ncbi:MAG TPA: outer membrane beta-barrel protein [Bryobacteraceae bacterium]|jgi:hypothetical protein|nr:outer membrane beta-barrel protein [Bryobacteraceae bacterium]
MKRLPLLLAMGCFSTMAWGQAGEFWFNYGWSIFNGNAGLGTLNPFTTGGSNDITLGNGYRFSFRFNFNVKDHYGAEVGYSFNHMSLNFDQAAAAALGSGPFSEAMHMHQGNFNALYYPFTGTDAKMRPFLTAGVQFDNFVPPGGSSYSGSTKFGANFGAGVKVHIHGIWAARLDAREYVTPKPSFGFFNNSGALWQTEISAGVGVGF